MNDVKQWFTEHAMGPMFQLSELQKETGVSFNVDVTNGTVSFDAKGSQHKLAKALHNKVLKFGTWEYVKDVPPPQPVKVVEPVTPTPSVVIAPTVKVDETEGVKLAEEK